ncbi:NAD(P)H-dependent oxidoreductase [Mesorhizobium atlanticum]
MGFNPVSDRRNFTTVRDANYYRQQAEEAEVPPVADGFAPDIQAEMDKLFWCDALILQFPLWWFGHAGDCSSGLGRPRVRIGWPHLWRRQMV